MRKYTWLLLLSITCCFTTTCYSQKNLKIVIIRHGEKPDDGDNLNCQGLNRSLALPKVLSTKFGIASYLFVPAVNGGNKTKSARMFQTISPYAIKYNLKINSSYDEDDYKKAAADAYNRKGTVIMVWEHNDIPRLAKALGVKDDMDWPASDFDSIWIITYKKEKAILTRDKEGLTPSANCPF